jgi:GNAT superfamily N-acetyltransferase
MTARVRNVTAGDEKIWSTLYSGYRSFYKLPEDAGAVARTWQWVMNGEHGMVGLVATTDDVPMALANLRWFAEPLTSTMALYLDDLFVSPDARSAGAGRALLRRTAEIAAEGDASVVQWITAADNATARRLYDAVARETAWITYEMTPVSGG